MGALLLAAGDKDKRFCLPNSRVMIHQPMGGFQARRPTSKPRQGDPLPAIAPERDHGEAHRPDRGAHLARHRRDNFLSADEAVKFGIVDKVLTSRAEAAAAAAA